MSIVNDEIQQLQLRILELEKQKKKKEEEEILKKESLEHNFKIINNELNNKKTFIDNKRSYIENKQSIINKSQIDKIMNDKDNKYGAYVEIQIFTYLEAIYNILQILNNRISDLENK